MGKHMRKGIKAILAVIGFFIIGKCAIARDITFESKQKCARAGITKASIPNDMKFKYDGATLVIGTAENKDWEGSCVFYDSNIKFNLKNLDRISEFLLTDVGFNDYMWIKINGKTIYIGPDGASPADRLELASGIIRPRIYDGYTYRDCERGTNWRFSPAQEILPYLKEGQNSIWVRTVVYGHGYGIMTFVIKEFPCDSWVEDHANR